MSMKFCQCLIANEIDEVEPCGNLVEGNTDMCASHNAFFRKLKKQNEKSIEKRNSQIAKSQKRNQEPRKLPSKVSEKRKELNKEYKILADEYKRTHPYCEIKVNEYCTNRTDDVHHRKGRGKYLLDTSTFVAVCRSCHIWVGDNYQEAKLRGFIESRLATTEPHKI